MTYVYLVVLRDGTFEASFSEPHPDGAPGGVYCFELPRPTPLDYIPEWAENNFDLREIPTGGRLVWSKKNES